MNRQTIQTVPIKKWTLVALAALMALSLGVTTVVSAAGGATLALTPGTERVEPGETTTVDIVVDGASGGVGAAELRVVVDDPAVATIQRVDIQGEPTVSDVTRSEDGSAVDVAYAAANTDDSGSVVALTVTIEGEASGSTGVSLAPRGTNSEVAVYDEEGAGYDLSSAGDATITVRDVDDDDDDNDDIDGDPTDQTDPTATPAEPTATATPSQTTTEAPVTAEDDPAQSTTTSSPVPTDDTDEDSGNEETATSSPGFGLALAVVALIAAALLAGRRD